MRHPDDDGRERIFSSQSERGTATVIALIMLVLLTVLGISATNTSTIDIQIAGNQRVYKESFYLAEGALMEAAQRLFNESSIAVLTGRTAVWLNDMSVDFEDLGLWVQSGDEANAVACALDADAAFSIVDCGAARGASLGLETGTVHQFSIYGRSDKNGATVLLEMGFRKRF
jgi:hypothetical protein